MKTLINEYRKRLEFISNLRETFFFNQPQNVGDVTNTKWGDLVFDGKYIFEAGDSNKKFTQIADIPNSYLAIDETEIGFGNKIPLWMFGLLY
jgi:hypothetical protein